jgi:hypothetical protein
MASGATTGPRERHLMRRETFPYLFGSAPPEAAELQKARAEDQQQAAAFAERFRALVGEAASLRPNEESEHILDLKARLDHAYTEAAGLGGDHRAAREGIRRLIEIIMHAVHVGAKDDATALAELEGEAVARANHFALLEQPFVADLILPGSPVSQSELVPTLLSGSEEEVEAAMWLFDPEQLSEIIAHARALLTGLAARGVQMPEASARLLQLERGAPPSN